MKRLVLTVAVVLTVVCSARAVLHAQEAYKHVSIRGLRIYSEKFIIERLALDKLKKGAARFDEAARAIHWFYHKDGYILATAFLVEETEESLIIHVDEGLLGKIIFHDLNTLDTLRMKYDFTLRRRIYNKQSVDDEIERLNKKYRFRDLYAIIKPVRSYEGTLFQLDRDVAIPMAGGTGISIFEEYGNRYDLEVFIARESAASSKNRSFKLGLDINYSKGLIPSARYRWPSMIMEGDRMEVGASTGVYYGLDLDYAAMPRITFMESHARYDFKPTLRDYFVPVLKGSIYNSRASRADLGLTSYNFTLVRATGDPGIVILKKLKLYAGYGGEKAYVFDSKADPEAARQVAIRRGTEYWSIFEAEAVLDFIPWTLRGTLERKFVLTYNYYFNGTAFNEIVFKGDANHEFRNFDLYDFHMDYARLWGNVPFYHEVPVDGTNFRGLLGKAYHTHRIVRTANEYRISLYRDYVYGGVFADGAWFRGSEYDLSGEQYAAVAGIAGHFIFLDQFEFNIFYGKDYLYPERSSQFNLYFNMEKKW